MTYGVYTDDLHAISLGEVSLETARKYLHRGYVICSEKRITTGFRLTIHFHKNWYVGWNKYESRICLGYVTIKWEKTGYMWADKIVERFKEVK